MREILFRGKRIDNGEWEEGFYVRMHDSKGRVAHKIHSGYTDNIYGNFYSDDLSPEGVEVDPSTIGQFTGRCDKNGKKIFEGDILHFWSDYREAYTGECVVKYGDFNCNCCEGVYGWYLENGDIRYLSYEENPVYEVCGNIHDNPELLEVEG